VEARHLLDVGGPTTAAAVSVARQVDPAEVVPPAAGDDVAEKYS